MHANCNTTHTALTSGWYFVCIFKSPCRLPQLGEECAVLNWITPSAVCVVDLLGPHSPDLALRGHYIYCKGGATQLHPSITPH